jgi:hypothetical protein
VRSIHEADQSPERCFTRWASPSVLSALPGCFPRSDRPKVHRARQATVRLFNALAQETQEARNLPSNRVRADAVPAMIDGILRESESE